MLFFEGFLYLVKKILFKFKNRGIKFQHVIWPKHDAVRFGPTVQSDLF